MAEDMILIITATLTALMAGLFYSFSCAVNLGLGRLSDSEYIVAMKSINKSILNPVFFIGFFGAPLLLFLSSYLHYGQPLSMRFMFLTAAAITYITGVFGVTVFGNVPLNKTLDVFNLQSASIAEIARQRAEFEKPWNRLNTIRTISSILAIILVIIACLFPKPE